MKDLKGKGKLLVFKNVKPLQGHKENGDAAKAMSWEQGSNPAILDGREGSSSAGTWLEIRLLQTKGKKMRCCYELSLAAARKAEPVNYYVRGSKLTWLITVTERGRRS